MTEARKDLASVDLESARALGLGMLGLAGVTYVLIVLGALVRAHGAGLACPDWPLCFGEVIPEFDFKVAFEWGHRALAGSVGLAFVALAALVLRRPSLRRSCGAGLAIAALLLGVQVVLGGLTVIELLARWTVTSHLLTGNAFALTLVLIGRHLLRRGASPGDDRPEAELATRLATTLAAVLLVIQMLLGGIVSSSYAGLACPEWPTCMHGEFFPTWRGIQGIHLLHRTVGYGVALAIGAAAWLARSQAGAARRWIGAAAALAALQVCVGVANVLLRIPVEITGLHSALAAGLVCTLGVGFREVWRGSPAH